MTLTNAQESIELEHFTPPKPLPPRPKDLPLCEIRDMKAGEIVPAAYERSEIEGTGYIVWGSGQTLMWDHHFGTQGNVALANGQDVFFEGPEGLKVLRKLTPYATSASFGVKGLYCEGY